MASILLIDDDPQVRFILRAFLTRCGHVVREAGDGVEGLRLFGQERPCLVLCDLHLGQTCGLDTLREMRRLDPAARLVALSGDLSALAVAQEHGASTTLAKPFPFDGLVVCVDEVLAQPV